MKFTFSIIFLCSIVFMDAHGKAIKPRVIYGLDDRMDYFESNDSLMKELSRSTAVQILNHSLDEVNGEYKLKAQMLKDGGMCESERFANQPVPGNCSGFLIAEDLLVTAGHCIRQESDCENHFWVFDFINFESENKDFTFNKDQVVRCKKIVSREKNPSTMNDFAVLKLEKKIYRRPFSIRTTGTMSPDTVFTVLGYPSGLPLKITTAGVLRSNDHQNYFVINADTYGGNSGSAVVDTKTGMVEGILVRGDQDYEQNSDACYASVKRQENGGRGEDATRITNIKF